MSFDIDANGIVNVSAVDKGTGKSNNITITASSNLSEEDIDRAIKEAEKYAEEDKKRKELIDAKNNAEHLILAVERTIEESGDKITEDEKKTLEEAAKNAKDKLKDAMTAEEVRQITEELGRQTNDIVAKLYQQQAQQAQPNDDTDKDDESTINIDPDDIK